MPVRMLRVCGLCARVWVVRACEGQTGTRITNASVRRGARNRRGGGLHAKHAQHERPRPDQVYLESVRNGSFIVREAPFGMQGVGTGYNAAILQRHQAPHDGHPQLAASLGVLDVCV